MVKKSFLVAITVAAAFLTGCVERQLTINTQPKDAMVILNDEQLGLSPVTVSFNWYGVYNIRITKDGYETLKTHRRLKRPLHDYFPFDFFAQCLNPQKIVNSYEWTFEMAEKQYPDRQELIDKADALEEQML